MSSTRLATFAALALLASCGGSPQHAGKKQPNPGPLLIVTGYPVRVTGWDETFEAAGTVRARTTAVVAARMMGTILSVSADAGDRVTSGQPLVMIDGRELEVARRQAESAVTEARSGIPEAESAISSARAQLDLAELTAKRMSDLLARRSVSQQEFDEAAARVRVAKSAVDMARARRQQLEARIRQAEEAVQRAQVAEGYTAVNAPFTGRVIARKTEPGAMATPGSPMFEIEREGAYRFEARVEESRIGVVKRGAAVHVRIDAIETPLTGRVAEIVPASDESTHSLTVRIDLPAHTSLRTGLFGRASFAAGSREALAVPAEAVSWQGQLAFVAVAEDGAARMRMVKTGDTHGGVTEILSGLNGGDIVIHPRPVGLSDGVRVEVKP